MFLEWGVGVSYETIRRWAGKFGPTMALGLNRRQPRPGDICRLDEVAAKTRGRKFWLWRAVDQNGMVLNEILQCQQGTKAAKRLLARLIKNHGRSPKRFITEKLRSYSAAKREITPGVELRSQLGLNNRAKDSHLPFRKRERAMQRYRSPVGLEQFVSIHSSIRNRFSAPARRRSALTIGYHRLEALGAWNVAAHAA